MTNATTWMDDTILARPDGSYVIIHQGLPCHVPASEEWADLHAQLEMYAAAHPDKVMPDIAPPVPLAEAKRVKAEAILMEANRTKAKLSCLFSRVEESTWPEQEAGARQILGEQAHTQNVMARLVLADSTSTATAVALVESLAAIDGVSAAAFARRIADNADAAQSIGLQILKEQRTFESALTKATTMADVQAINIAYSVLQKEGV